MPLNAGIRKLARNGRGSKLPIPRHVLDALHWTIGTSIYIQINPDDTVTLAAIRVAPITPTPPAPNAQVLTQERGPNQSERHA